MGNAATLLAKSAGAWVVTTVLNEKQAKIAKESGADLVVDRYKDDVKNIIKSHTVNNGVDRIIDVNLISNLDLNMACISQGGVISSYATPDAETSVEVPLLKAMINGCVFRFVYIYNVPKEEKLESVKQVNKLISQGMYKPYIGKQFSFSEIIKAHEALESREVIGKILVNI